MKKYYFMMAAVSAMMLTACSSEDDVLQTGPQKVVENSAVGFDVYTPAATQTRAGLAGTMTTSRLQRSQDYGGGFGVYAYLVQDADNDATATAYNPSSPGVPNFMVNEKLLWNTVNQGWYYNPLKYWPNETNNDSQNSPATMEGPDDVSTGYKHLDRLTFFAYAPYVETSNTSEAGITYLTNNNGVLSLSATGSGQYPGLKEASIGYKAAIDNPDEAVDLLWGVAPAGGLTYTAVNGQAVNVAEGMPLIDMTKPNVNTNMKFLFQHALARIGVTAVAAVDQVGAGGTLDPNTKITIEKITLTGYFGTTGVLNLDNNNANVANWRTFNSYNTEPTNDAKVANTGLTTTTLTLTANHTTPDNGTIATHLQWVNDATAGPDAQTNRLGVTTVKQNVIQPSKVKHCVSSIDATSTPLAYSETTPYYTTWTRDAGFSGLASAQLAAGDYYTYGEDGSWTIGTLGASDPAGTYQYPRDIIHFKSSQATLDKTFVPITTAELASKYKEYQVYTKSGFTYTPVADVPEVGKGHYVLDATMSKAQPTYPSDTYYKRDANYFMVIPTNNIQNICTSLEPAEREKLRTVKVLIEYYITTEDAALKDKRAQTKNVIEKDVVFPSLANGKSYNLNLILGLTSVKMEAEVDDWKVINVQADLPQNTAE